MKRIVTIISILFLGGASLAEYNPVKIFPNVKSFQVAFIPSCGEDDDKDGISNSEDLCPNTPYNTPVDVYGCSQSDSDNDRVVDYEDNCPEIPEGVNMDNKGGPMDTDTDMIVDYEDQYPNTSSVVKVDNKDIAGDKDADGVPDFKDACPDTPKGIDVDQDGCIQAVKLEIHFDFNKTEVKDEYYAELEMVAEYMKKFPEIKVVIEGHTDNLGSTIYNLKLSQKRADAVRSILINKFGILPERIIAKGYGETRPIASNNTPEGRAKNRRVIAVFIK